MQAVAIPIIQTVIISIRSAPETVAEVAKDNPCPAGAKETRRRRWQMWQKRVPIAGLICGKIRG